MEDGVFSTPGQQPEPKVAQDTDKNQNKSKKGRVIIRNLVFDVNETHLRKLFQKYGQINDIKIPINPATNKTKGFAFIELENRNKALKAIKELNESKYKGRTILLDLAVEKAKYETKKNPGKKDSNKDQNEKGQKSQRVSSIRNDDDMEEEEEEEDEDFEGEEEEDDEEDFDEEEDDEEEDEKEDEEEDKKKKEDLSSTIFVRNISYEVGQSEFKDFFQKFGKLHYAKLVINRETETHNGTGFVKFNSPAIAQKLVDESKKLEDGLAVLKGESSGVSDVSLELGGRRMIVLPALGKRDVENLKATKKEKDQENAPKNQNTLEYWIHNDRHKKRNIYLASSGLNDPKDTLNALDKKKFEDNFKEKIEKIKNPNYCISTTRVIFKNLPKHDFDEQDIREVILKVLSQKYEQKIIKTTRLVSKIAVIREKERQDSDGNQRSRGYGFAEFTRHEDALFFLSKIKDNYKLISDRMPIVEFAIEDIRELRKREKLLKKLQSKKVEVKTDDDAKKKKKEELANKEEKNAEKLARLRISQLLEQNDTTAKTYAEIKDLMKKVKSRGLKQRLNNKVNAKFPSGGEQKKPKEKVAKPVKAIEVKPGQSRLEAKMEKRKEEKNQKRLNKIAESNEKVNEEMTEEENEAMLIKNIRRMIKNSKRSKRRAEERDEFDDIADAYQRKVQKL